MYPYAGIDPGTLYIILLPGNLPITSSNPFNPSYTPSKIFKPTLLFTNIDQRQVLNY
ncbi:hypothetical protein DKAM_0393 [Desulfurococcus amylolyticus 1221n]|uniref:Uncharacterized protein n=1 Tax=Desulfurococcus amylolyticus (strain DSM 18924 / JCM 16383 / VKM B-2413 / 1221n) TaxID=490899 RepID=B8D3N8_DESA1|nr:hypothetical protein DKAM_0393 [Desulfurococcus amylolyticus 1221n]